MRTLTKEGYLDRNDHLVMYPSAIKECMDTVMKSINARIKDDFQEDVVDIAPKMYYLMSKANQQYFHVDLVEDSFQVAIALSNNQLPTQHIPHERFVTASQALKNLGIRESSTEKMSFSWCVENRSAELSLPEDKKEQVWLDYVKHRKDEDPTFGETVNAGGYTYTPCKGCHRGPGHPRRDGHPRREWRKILLLTFSVGHKHKHYDGTQTIGSVHALLDSHVPWESKEAQERLQELTLPNLGLVNGDNLIIFDLPESCAFAKDYVDALTQATKKTFPSLLNNFKVMQTLYDKLFLSEKESLHQEVYELMKKAHIAMQSKQHVLLLPPCLALAKVEQQMEVLQATLSSAVQQLDAHKAYSKPVVHPPDVVKLLWPQFAKFASPVCCKLQKPMCQNSKKPFANFALNRKHSLQFYCAACLPDSVPGGVHPLFQNAHTLPIGACFDLFVLHADTLLPPEWFKGKDTTSSSI